MTGAFETGIYRNVFKECGYTEAEIEQRVEDTFRRIFHGTKEEWCAYSLTEKRNLTVCGNGRGHICI